jgi:hypothetical protein
VEVTAEAMERALDPFMAVAVNSGEELPKKWGTRWDVEAPLERHQAIDDGPGRRTLVGEAISSLIATSVGERSLFGFGN